jgi:hypothetical protein
MAVNPIVVREADRTTRRTRRPQHRFQLKVKPWQIQPFAIAPVLPGETMQNALLQVREVTDPLANPLIGWWSEWYLFYVKLRDLDGRDDFAEMMIDREKDLSSYKTGDTEPSAARALKTYHPGLTSDVELINWTNLCLDRVVTEYFRDESDNPTDLDSMPVAKIMQNSWLDSVINDTDWDTPDVTIQGNLTDLTGDETITASEIELALQQYQYMRDSKLTDMSFEEYVQTYGVNIGTAEEPHRPELIRYAREWTYPTNTVDASDGTPSSACSWSIAERADKNRFFREPGFIFGLHVVRPKVYLSNQFGSAAHVMDDVFSWLPAVLREDTLHSFKEFAASKGPLQNNTDGYWLDVRDLFMYGDQFINFDVTETNAGLIALPTAGLEKKYPTEAMADALFSDTTTPRELVKSDGVLSLAIASRVRDLTPTS